MSCRRRRSWMSLAVALLLILPTRPTPAADATVQDFEPRTITDADGNTLVYRLFKPAGYDPAKRYPIVLFLHGAGERGSDNAAQVKHILPLAKEAVQKEHPCFILAPQCPMQRKAFAVWGTGKDFDPTYNNYDGSASTWKSYTIELGKLPTGAKTRLMIVNQPEKKPAGDATGGAPTTSSFRNVRVYERGAADKAETAINFLDLKPAASAGKGKLTVTENGRQVTLTGDLRVKFPVEYKVTKDTLLAFDFMSPSRGAAHAIGLDTDDQFDYRWVQVDWGGKTHQQPKGPSAPMALALAALDGACKEFSIDPKRIYITGLSMGGYGTWDAIARRPGFFAAAIPICGGADETTAGTIKNLPIWCFHGGADNVVPTQRSRNMIEALKKAGGNPKYTEYPGVGHNSWEKAYASAETWAWLFGQTR